MAGAAKCAPPNVDVRRRAPNHTTRPESRVKWACTKPPPRFSLHSLEDWTCHERRRTPALRLSAGATSTSSQRERTSDEIARPAVRGGSSELAVIGLLASPTGFEDTPRPEPTPQTVGQTLKDKVLHEKPDDGNRRE
jgi:hypothetical protein